MIEYEMYQRCIVKVGVDFGNQLLIGSNSIGIGIGTRSNCYSVDLRTRCYSISKRGILKNITL